MTPEPTTDDIRDDEPDRELLAQVVNYIRQNRQGKELDAWDWGPCTPEDFAAARLIVKAARRHLLNEMED